MIVLAPMTRSRAMGELRVQCRCVWGARCPNVATQEDGLCDWCGKRTAEQLRDNPRAIFDPRDGRFLGLGGGGEAHVDVSRTPDACWMPDSGRVLAAHDQEPHDG